MLPRVIQMIVSIIMSRIMPIPLPIVMDVRCIRVSVYIAVVARLLNIRRPMIRSRAMFRSMRSRVPSPRMATTAGMAAATVFLR
jgi:hypothetical protein